MQLVTIDPHGPNELRCNGTLSNIAEFYEVEFAVLFTDHSNLTSFPRPLELLTRTRCSFLHRQEWTFGSY
jgi:hypothetical protein